MKPIYAAAIQKAAQKVTPMAVAPLRFTNTGEGEATVAFSDTKGNGTQLQYRKNEKKAFSEWDLSAVTLQPGEYMEVVGDTTAATKFIGHFVMTGTIAASGSVMSIVYGESITLEQNLIMPYNHLYSMDGSLMSIFHDCTSLTTAPELPAITLVDHCYEALFSGCSGLTIAPELPAITLVDHCYRALFLNCSGLTTAPELPATTLAVHCYDSLFKGCSGLNEVTVGFNDWGDEEDYATYDWLEDVAATGIFKCPAGLDTTTRDESHVPEGWTVENV